MNKDTLSGWGVLIVVGAVVAAITFAVIGVTDSYQGADKRHAKWIITGIIAVVGFIIYQTSKGKVQQQQNIAATSQNVQPIQPTYQQPIQHAPEEPKEIVVEYQEQKRERIL